MFVQSLMFCKLFETWETQILREGSALGGDQLVVSHWMHDVTEFGRINKVSSSSEIC